MQIDYKKAYALLWSKHEYQHSGEIFVKNIFKPFHDTGLFTDLFFDTSSDFFFLFEACIIYCFHAEFVFGFVLDVLIVVYVPRVYLIKKVKLILFS